MVRFCAWASSGGGWQPLTLCVWRGEVLEIVDGVQAFIFTATIFRELTVTLGELTGRVSHCCDESFVLQRWNKLKNTAEQLQFISCKHQTYFYIIYI